MGIILVSKMSAKSIIGKIKARLPKDEKGDLVIGGVASLFRVYGLATGVKKGSTNFGEWLSFSGQFEAVDSESGEVFQSANLFLPDVAQNLLFPAVMDESNISGVTFAFDVGVKEDKSADGQGAGYNFTVSSILEVKETDAMAHLKAALPPMKIAVKAQMPLAIEAEKVETTEQAVEETAKPKKK
jgi:hypothetical protein